MRAGRRHHDGEAERWQRPHRRDPVTFLPSTGTQTLTSPTSGVSITPFDVYVNSDRLRLSMVA